MTTSIILVLVALGAGNAAESSSAPSAPSPSAVTATAESLDLDFDLFEAKPAPQVRAASPELDAQIERRRSILGIHQVVGLGTLVVMGTTAVLGALNYRDLYGGGGRGGDYLWPHRIGVIATTLEFGTAGTLALLAPAPFAADVKDRGLSTATVHKTAAFAATVGMLTQLGLGFVTARRADAGNPADLRTLARAHQVVGYTTLACVATAALAWVF